MDRLLVWFSGLLGSTGRCVESLRSQWRSQLGRSGTDCGQLPRRMSSPEMASGFDSGDARTGVWAGGFGGVPDVEAGLLGWLAGAGRLWRGWSAAAQRSLCGGARRRRRLGFETARAWR